MAIKKNKIKVPIPAMASTNTLVKLATYSCGGADWYTLAQDEIEKAADTLEVSPQYYADILSIFSPRVSVKRNIRLANFYIIHRYCHPTTMGGVRVSLANYLKTGLIRGQKTRAFAKALMGDVDAVVLDVWMARAFGIDQRQFDRPAVARRCTDRINRAAEIMGWTPCQIQAAVWTTSVRAANRTPAPFKIIDGDRLEIAQ